MGRNIIRNVFLALLILSLATIGIKKLKIDENPNWNSTK